MSFEETLRKKLEELKDRAQETVEAAKQNKWKAPLGQSPRKGPPAGGRAAKR